MSGHYWTDMYALGMIFYEMLTGENLFKGDTIAEIFNNKAIQNYSKKFNSLKIEHKKIIASLTEPNINKRPNSYADVLGIINKFTKVDKCFKKFPFYKKDDRIAISNSKILGYWIKNFPDQASENIHYVTLGNIKAYKDIERARNFHKLGDYNASIKYCDSTLQFGKEYTIFDQYILKSPKGDNAPDILPDNSLIDVRLIVSSSAYYVLTLLFISSVDYIEAGGNDHAVLNLVKKYTDKTLYCKDLPEEVVAVLVQVLVKTKRYAEAYPIITSLLSSKFFLVRIKCYATLAILFFETKKIDALIDLINEKIIPETEKYNSHLAHRTCGQSLIFINNFELGAYHFYNAYLLDSSDLWSLKHSIIGYLNANKVDVAKRLFKIMFEQDANNPHTKGVISIFKQAKLIN